MKNLIPYFQSKCQKLKCSRGAAFSYPPGKLRFHFGNVCSAMRLGSFISSPLPDVTVYGIVIAGH